MATFSHPDFDDHEEVVFVRDPKGPAHTPAPAELADGQGQPPEEGLQVSCCRTVAVGARTALPAFVSFMTAAHTGRPRTEFPRPPGVVQAPVDPDTGLLPRPGQTNTVLEEFLDGTVPVQVAPEPFPLPDNTREMTYTPDPR